MGPVFLTLGGVRCFSGCKIFRALRARSPWRSWFVGDFWNPSALWWGQFDEMDNFLAFGQHQCKGQVILPTEQEKGETGSGLPRRRRKFLDAVHFFELSTQYHVIQFTVSLRRRRTVRYFYDFALSFFLILRWVLRAPSVKF